LANSLKQNLLALNQNLLIVAGTGNSEVIAYDTAVRSDSIYWLDKSTMNLKMLLSKLKLLSAT
jgi:SM-20-related protein